VKFCTPEDKKVEREISDILEKEWDCKIHDFGGDFSPIDSYAEKDGRLLAWLEYKNRSHSSKLYPTVFLNSHKWLALQLARAGHAGAAGLFVVKFTDGIFWIPVGDIPTVSYKIMGRRDRGAVSDIVPVIEVPISLMEKIAS
jgi:hypothetical protein